MIEKREYMELAKLYDIFMEEVDYKNWADKMIALKDSSGEKGKVLELGCGTGNLTLEFLKMGYEVVALDISQEMLTVADDKLGKYRSRLKLIKQDMKDMDIGKGYKSIFCGCDGFNYILDEKELLGVFKKCHGALIPGGSLVFDISSQWKIENVLGNNIFREERGNCEIFWMNSYNVDKRVLEMDITFFVPDRQDEEGEQLYKKFDEYHIQRAYSTDQIIQMLAKENFDKIEVFGADGKTKPKEKDERLFFSCRKRL